MVNHYAGSISLGMEYRPYYLAREWKQLGHEVTVIASSESHVRTVKPEIHGGVTQGLVDGVPYIWLRTPKYQGNGAGRAINIFAFVSQLFRHGRRIAHDLRPDVVIASSTYPLDNVPARRIASLSGAKLVYEVHDLWPLSPIELGGLSPRHPFIRLMQWAEDYAYARADKVVSMLPKAAAHMESRGMAPDKFACVPNGVYPLEGEEREMALPQEHREAIDCLKEQGKFIIGYAGAHGVANSLDCVIAGARMLQDKGVSFVLVGQGPEKARLQQIAIDMGAVNMLFLPPIPKSAVGALLREMDVLFVGLRRTPIFRFGISPNKLMDYMMASKPVILSVEAGNDMVAESGCGLSTTPESPEALVEAVLDLKGRSAAERLEMGRRGKEFVMKYHDYRVLAQQFIDAVREV